MAAIYVCFKLGRQKHPTTKKKITPKNRKIIYIGTKLPPPILQCRQSMRETSPAAMHKYCLMNLGFDLECKSIFIALEKGPAESIKMQKKKIFIAV